MESISISMSSFLHQLVHSITFVATNRKIHGFRFHTSTTTFRTLPLQADWKEFRESFVLVLPPVTLQDAEQVEAALAKAEPRPGSL